MPAVVVSLVLLTSCGGVLSTTGRKYSLKALAITCGLSVVFSHVCFFYVDVLIFINYSARFYFYNVPGGFNFVIGSKNLVAVIIVFGFWNNI